MIVAESGCKILSSNIDSKTWEGYLGMRKFYGADGKPIVIK